jgi:hypothetical protein
VPGADTECGADRAARAVRTDDVPGVHPSPGAEVVPGAESGTDAVGPDAQVDERGREADLPARLAHGVDEHRFEQVLRAGQR